MANFDDKSIFTKKQNENASLKNKEEKEDEALSVLTEELKDETVLEEKTELPVEEEKVKIIAEETVESDKDRKIREKREKKETRLQEKERQKMIMVHRKALKKNPENIKRYDTDPQSGLPDDIVEKRVFDNLVNSSKKGSTKSIKKIIFSNIFTFFNIVTITIAVWLMTVQAWTDLVFLVIVTANVIIGIYQEIKAKKAIDRLSLISAPSARVIRGGIEKEINVEEVVLDDLLVLHSGNQICADSVVVDGTVEVNESLLTGESNAIIKNPGDLLFSGSFVVSGKCRARVDKVGKENYIEKLADQAKKYQKPKSDLLKSLNLIIIVMAVLIIPIGITLFCLQHLINGIDYITAVRKTAGAMVGMIPSGLWLLTSVALFVGIIRLSQKNVLVQELYCIEMLARVNVLCLDKTGTITDGTMSVKNVIDYNSLYGLTTKNIVSAMLNALNESNLTSKALEDKFGLNKRIKHLATIPFSSQRKLNAVTFDKMGTFALGAPEFVLKKYYATIQKDVDRYADQGYRVLCLAHFNGMIENNHLPESTPEVISLILIEDNIRPDAIQTIDYFKKSGVSVRVISGDNPITVSKISQRAGIENADQYISLDGLSDSEVERAALKYTVFGRVSPSQKRLLVTTLKNAGHTVAMTGDGVNDILALKEADCSIAIASGSEAARNVSHLVLLDSNFGSMPKVVAEGRRVINNVTSVAALFLTKTIFSLLLAIQAMLSGGAYPISTNQLIMIDFFAIGLPSFFLALEPNNKEVEGRFLSNVIKGALPGALTILIIAMMVFLLSDGLNLDSISLSTIIVLAATHTCLMVLFKVCKPFNTLRRSLCIGCYTAALLISFLLPQFLELRPLVSFSEYYSSSLKQTIMKYCPEIQISDDYYYVFDGKVTQYQRVPSESRLNVSSTYDESSSKFYYMVNQTNLYEEVVIPELSYLTSNSIVLGGDPVYIYNKATSDQEYLKYEENYVSYFSVDQNGYLYYKDNAVYKTLKETDEYYGFYNKYGGNLTKEVHICIMPTVILKNDQLIVTPATSSSSSNSGIMTYKTALTTKDTLQLKIDTKTMELLVNDQKLYMTLDDGTQGPAYKVELPTFSFNKNLDVLVNGIKTDVSVEKFGISQIITGNTIADTSLITVVPYDASYYIIDKTATSLNPSEGANSNVALSNLLICPDITTTESGYYIIGGYYTEFKATSDTPEPKIDDQYNLILGNIVTDYKISASTVSNITGGMVKELSVSGKVFLIMLCLLSIPLMRFFQMIVPWIKNQVAFVKKLLSKF